MGALPLRSSEGRSRSSQVRRRSGGQAGVEAWGGDSDHREDGHNKNDYDTDRGDDAVSCPEEDGEISCHRCSIPVAQRQFSPSALKAL